MFVARPMPSTAVPGLPVILRCSQQPIAPVTWSFQHLPDSEAQIIVTGGSIVSDYAEKYGTYGSSLIIYKVQSSDGGSYNCSDANGDIIMYSFAVDGEEIAVILMNEK